MRRWYRAVTQYCPGFQFDANQTIEHQPWECHLLKLGIEQNRLRLTQAKRVISMSVQEVLFSLLSHSDLSSCWFSRKQHPIALLEIQEFLPPAQKLWEQWQEMGLEQICPDQVPVLLKQSPDEEGGEVGSGSLGIRGRGGGEVGRWGGGESHLLSHSSTQNSKLKTQNSLSALAQFITGDQTIWDIAMQVKQPVADVASALMTLANQDVLALQTVPDFPVPVEVTSQMPTHSSVLKPLVTIDEVITADELAHHLQACVQDRFTGRLDIEDTQVQQWSLYFHSGDLTGCSCQVHPLRRWCRQLSVHCPQLQNAVSGQELDWSSCWDYASLATLVNQGEVLQEQIAAVVEGYITEILFDIYQQSERMHYRSEQITYRRIPHETINTTLGSIAVPLQVQQQAMQTWEAWQRAGLVDCFPNLAPVILQPEELRRQTSPNMYRHLTALVTGNLTLRDLAVKLQQHLLPLTQSIMPYIHQGLMGLTEVEDFSCVMPPYQSKATVPASGVQSHIQLEQGETMSALIRSELGDFSSIVCFKAVITGMEDALGEKATAIALISAGRARGKKLADDLGLTGATGDLQLAGHKLAEALGKSGTRLCKIEKIYVEGDAVKVYTSETVCSAGEEQGSQRKCTFTLGAVWGALEQVLGKRLQGKHTESVLRGGNHDVFEFTVLERA